MKSVKTYALLEYSGVNYIIIKSGVIKISKLKKAQKTGVSEQISHKLSRSSEHGGGRIIRVVLSYGRLTVYFRP